MKLFNKRKKKQLVPEVETIRYPNDFDKASIEIIQKVSPYTMTGTERIFTLIRSTEYILKNKIAGAFVECGVWKGGSAMAMLEVLKNNNIDSRDIYLYDTFDGMSAPTEKDIDWSNNPAAKQLAEREKTEEDFIWAYAPLDGVKKNLALAGYNPDRLHYIKGRVEETIPGVMPNKIALLRLDTDWYESTKHEMEHLFPKLEKGSILILDDYGHWQGAKKAVDEYIQENNIQIFLSRIDDTGRIAVKL